jgi:structural maintenance of chromosome 3 (chondroitin sulfate proteoglycan 6)
MQENQQSISKINEILDDINSRLEELRGETQELKSYQEADRQRKALEYTLYDKELRKARHVLDHLEQERMEHALQTTRLHEQTRNTHEAIQNAEAQLKNKSQALKRNRTALAHLEADKTRTVTAREKLKLLCQELQEQVVSGEETLKHVQQQLVLVEKQIAEAMKSQAHVNPIYKAENASLSKMILERDQAQRKMDGLYAKQGRGKQYSSVQERDGVIRQQIAEFQTQKAEKEQYLADQRDALGNLRRTISSETAQVSTKQSEISEKQGSLQSINKALDEKQKERLALHETRKQTWREAEELQEQTREARETMHKAMSDTRKSMPRATAMGLKALRGIVDQERLVVGEQYFGMLMENMTLKDPKYQTAVEVATQNSLFHVIVDTDATAARLMQKLEEGRLGRVTFLPLNRLRTDETQYPQSSDVTPMLDTCIEYDPKVAGAMRHVFDKKLLARTPEVASEWSSKSHMDAITLDGDLCSRKGALTGGYVDLNKSRLRAFAQQRKAQQDFASVEREYREVDAKAKQAEQDVTNASQEVSRLQHKQAQLQRLTTALESQVEQLQSQLGNREKQTEKLETQTLPPVEREIAAAEGDIGRLQDEIGTELTSTLSDDDRTMLTSLKQEHSDLMAAIGKQAEVVDELNAERQKLSSLLEDNLLKRRQELTHVKDTGTTDDDDQPARGDRTTSSMLDQEKREMEEREQQFQEASGAADEVESRVEEAREAEEELKAELNSARNELEKLKSEDMKHNKQLEEASEKSEKLMSKVSEITRLSCVSWDLGICSYSNSLASLLLFFFLL